LTAPKQVPTRIVFGSYEVDPAAGELRRSGFRIHLPPQPFQLLLTLLDSPGETVTRDELQQQLWGNDTFVDFEHGLNAAVKKLRQALGDSADAPRFIETLPGRGYRFLPPVERVPLDGPRLTPPPDRSDADRRRAPRALWVFASVFLVGCLASYWLGARRLPPELPQVVQFRVAAPEGYLLQPAALRQGFSLSPDGSSLAFTALNSQGRFTLWVQELAGLEPKPVPRTEGIYSVSWALDGRSLFYTSGTELRRIALDGDTPLVLCALPPRMVAALPLASGETLLTGSSGWFVVPPEGGQPRLVEGAKARWPQLLPDHEHLLSISYDAKTDRHRLLVSRYGDASPGHELLETDSRVQYVPSATRPESGYLLYLRAGNLVAQPFDPQALRVTGTPTPIASDIFFFRVSGAADFSVSGNGALAYQPTVGRSQLTWVDRAGREIAAVGPSNVVVKYARLSPDGRSIVASLYNLEKGASQLWTFDTANGVTRQVTALPGYVDSAVWSPDSKRLAYGRASDRPPLLYVKGLNEQDPEEALPQDRHQFPSDWSPDGRFIAYSNLEYANTERESNSNLLLVDLENNRKVTPLLHSAFHEGGALFSPDGKWLAFVTTESGKPEIYVQAFEGGDNPRLQGERLQVSRGGAYQVHWRRDGRELFCFGIDNKIYAVPVTLGPRLTAGAPVELFALSRESTNVTPFPFGFDVSADGQRFLVPAVRDPRRPSIVVVKNWEGLLRRQAQ
jgi:eukaryotic-like serine/threonine-protein kinase